MEMSSEGESGNNNGEEESNGHTDHTALFNQNLGLMCEIKILEIAGVLQESIIYLNGGVNKDGEPLLLCRSSPALLTVIEHNFNNASLYLKSIASLLWPEKKFLVIVNACEDKWYHVKILLKLLQTFAAEEVSKIMLLKPQGFLQKHFSVKKDATKIQALSKHKVEFLESVSALDEQVDLSQLPDTLSGYHMFSVQEWIEYSTAVERFQRTCMKVGDRVKDVNIRFTQPVASSNVEEIDVVFSQHEQLVEDISTDIQCSLEIFDTLEPIVSKPLSHSRREQTPLGKYNCTQLEECSVRLKDLRKLLEDLWRKQRKYLQQAKEISEFEQAYGKVSGTLIGITSVLEGRTDIGDSLATAKELVEELDYFELERKEPYAEMMKLKERGTLMLATFLPFARDSVRHRCDEIKLLCDDFESKLKARRDLLKVSLDVFTCLEKIDLWCEQGVKLVASQSLENLQSVEGAKKCLQEINQFMQDNQGINMKKLNQIHRMCEQLNNEALNKNVQDALKKMEETKEMLESREKSLKKVVNKSKRPVQPVKALVVQPPEKSTVDKRLSIGELLSPGGKGKPISPAAPRKDIVVVVGDDIEKFKRNKTFRKSLKESFRRPVTSPDQLKQTDNEEDPEHRKKLRHVTTELLKTETDYVTDLKSVLQSYYLEFDNPAYSIPDHIRTKKHIVFGNIEEIHNFHNDHFLQHLEVCNNAPYMAGQVFLNYKEEFQLYASYCKNKSRSESLREELQNTSSFLLDCQRELGHQLNLDSYLLKPVQRITKYRLLLTEMLKHVSKNHLAHSDIVEALQMMNKVLRYVNDVVHSSGIMGFAGNLDKQGKLLLQDSFLVWKFKKNAIRQFKLGGKQRQVFLFEKCLIFSKKEVAANGKELGTYQNKIYISTADIGVTEFVKGDDCKLEISVHTSNEVLILQAGNVELKNLFLKELRSILIRQFAGVKETISRKERPLSEIKLSTEDLRRRLKILDNSMSGSSPALIDVDDNNDDQSFDQLKSIIRAQMNPVLKDYCSDTNQDTDDENWSDSEFDEEDTAFNNNVVSSSSTMYVAIADYTAVEPTEMSFKCHDVVRLLREGEGGWWYCEDNEGVTQGWTPSGYLTPQNVGNAHACEVEACVPTIPSPRKRIETAV